MRRTRAVTVANRTLVERAKEYGNLADAVSDCALVVGPTAVGTRTIKHAIERLEAVTLSDPERA